MTAGAILVASAAVALLSGCAGIRAQVRGWVEAAPPPPSHGSTRPDAYYAAGSVPVHATPSSASKVVGRLAPNARVTRTQVDGGWARIAADGVAGWVDASRLVHHPPHAAPPPDTSDDAAPSTDVAPVAPAAAASPPAPEAATPPPDPAPEPAPVAVPTPAPSRRPPPAVEDPF